MDLNTSVGVFAALAQPTRLAVFKHLVAAEPQGLPAGEIARKLEVPHNTMSSHLATLERAGLVASVRHSRSMIYRVQFERIQEVVMYLLNDCCSRRADVCAPIIAELGECCEPTLSTALR